MRAARWYAAGDVRVDEVPVPVPHEDEALVEVSWCGICGSDLEEYADGPVVIPRGPLTLGHEVVGRVVRPAPDGSGPGAGTRVVVDVVDGCGRCWWCLRHEEGLCPDLRVRGLSADGGLAGQMSARAARLVPVPDALPDDLAALAEPLAVAVRALGKCGSVLGRTVAVLGGGTVGQLVARVARAVGAAHVVVVDPQESRRWIADEAGADLVLAPEDRALAAALSPTGVDIVIECAGRPGLAAVAVALVRRGGTVVLLGVTPGPSTLDLLDLVLGEKVVLGSAAHRWDDDVRTAVHLLASGTVRVDDLVTARIPLAEVVTQGLHVLRDRPSEALKILVDCR